VEPTGGEESSLPGPAIRDLSANVEKLRTLMSRVRKQNDATKSANDTKRPWMHVMKTTSDKVKVGVIGVGYLGRIHAAKYKNIESDKIKDRINP